MRTYSTYLYPILIVKRFPKSYIYDYFTNFFDFISRDELDDIKDKVVSGNYILSPLKVEKVILKPKFRF